MFLIYHGWRKKSTQVGSARERITNLHSSANCANKLKKKEPVVGVGVGA
jgi:hypothetical protein